MRLAPGETTDGQRALPLTRWELASGTAFGVDEGSPGLPPPAHRTPGEALAHAVLPALQTAPCVVSFSGGIDSSAVLALAVDTARKHGLPDPIPVSLRFPGVRSTEESAWQELVVSHLKLSDWQRIEITDELDFLGGIAQSALTTYGLLWPANAHFHAPVFAQAAGGSVLTGVDGDGLFRGWRWQRARTALAHPTTAQPRDALRILFAAAPPYVRAAGLFPRLPIHFPWLYPKPARQVRARIAREQGREPNRWDARVARYARRRYLRLGVHSLRLLAEQNNTRAVHPLLDPQFLSTLAVHGGAAGLGTRDQAMRRIIGDLLPRELLTRRTKGEFGRALWGGQARQFAADWNGGGLDLDLIDPEALARTWRAENPPLAAATLLQAAWLAASANRSARAEPSPPARADRAAAGD